MHFKFRDAYLSVVWVISAYFTFLWRKLLPTPTIELAANVSHRRSINIGALSSSIKSKRDGVRLKVDRSARALSSNSMRATSQIGSDVHVLRLGPADRVLLIDTKRSEVTVEPGVTMEQLVDALLPHKLVPFVVPEFKALTVGGVLAGAGIESSSWSHGQFGDHLVSARYLLSDGSVVDCSPYDNEALFYGALGACGTLGLLISATLKIQRIVTDFVNVEYNQVPTLKSVGALRARMDVIRSTRKNEFLDAIVYSETTTIVTAKLNHPGPATQTFSRGRDPWFYQHLAETQRSSDIVPIKDYFFRYDAGAFWMSQYAISPVTDFLPVIQSFIPPITDPYTSKILEWIPFGGYNWLSRWLLSPLLSTATLYSRLHSAPVSVVADTLVIQDVYIPTASAEEFLTWLRAKFGGEKIWLCPMRGVTTPQILGPHYQKNNETGDDIENGFINFGIWLHKPHWQPGTVHARQATRAIEHKVHEFGGRKMLYSLSSYPRDEWDDIYDSYKYSSLKQRFDPSGAWGDIYDKVGKPLA